MHLVFVNCHDEYLQQIAWYRPVTLETAKNLDFGFVVSEEFLPLTLDQHVQIIFSSAATQPCSDGSLYIFPRHADNNSNIYADWICQVIRNYYPIYTFGDSHTIITSYITLCRENWLGFNTDLPITMFRFAREGLDLDAAVQACGNGHELFPVIPGSFVMYSVGEIDVRYLLLRENSAPFEQIIDQYMARIKENEVKFQCRSIVYFIIPPAKITAGVNLFTGSLSERKVLYQKFVNYLAEACQTNHIPICSIYDKIIDHETETTQEIYLQPNDIHLTRECYPLVRDELVRILLDQPYIPPVVIPSDDRLDQWHCLGFLVFGWIHPRNWEGLQLFCRDVNCELHMIQSSAEINHYPGKWIVISSDTCTENVYPDKLVISGPHFYPHETSHANSNCLINSLCLWNTLLFNRFSKAPIVSIPFPIDMKKLKSDPIIPKDYILIYF